MCTSWGVSCSRGTSVASRMSVCWGLSPWASPSSSTSSWVEARRRTAASSSRAWFSSAASARDITCGRERGVKRCVDTCPPSRLLLSLSVGPFSGLTSLEKQACDQRVCSSLLLRSGPVGRLIYARARECEFTPSSFIKRVVVACSSPQIIIQACFHS